MYSQEVLDRDGPSVHPEPAPVRPTQRAEFHRHERLVAPAAQRAPNQQLVVPGAIVVARVEERDAGVERRMNRGDAFAFVGGPVHAGHAHTAERERKDCRAGRAERSRLRL